MTALNHTPGISIASGASKCHVDDKKGLARQFAVPFPLSFFSSKGAWKIDDLAEHAPWRVTVASNQAITFSRLAVHRAREAAITVIRQKRGQSEARATLQKGYRDERGDVIGLLRLAASKPQQPLNLSEMTALFFAGLLVESLGLKSPPAIAENGICAELAAWLETIDGAVSLGPGRPSTFDLNSFFQSLVKFWDRNMLIRAPSSYRPHAKSRKKLVSFYDFAIAAARDAGCSNSSLRRAISRAVVAVRWRETPGK